MKKTVFIALISLIVMFFVGVFAYQLFGYWFVEPVESINGFTDDLVKYLAEDYGFTVPDNAKFISGENEVIKNKKKDNWLVIYFELPANPNENGSDEQYVYTSLKLDPLHYKSAHKAPTLQEEDPLYKDFDMEFSSEKHPFTTISYKTEGDVIVIKFKGYKPTYRSASDRARDHFLWNKETQTKIV